jgi:hypothetical protein
MFGMITLAGVGWAGGLAGGPLWRRVALAPATGVAVLVPVALVAERVELRVGGGGGVVVWAGVALAGAVAAASRVPDAAELLLADPALRSPGRASRSEEP